MQNQQEISVILLQEDWKAVHQLWCLWRDPHTWLRSKKLVALHNAERYTRGKRRYCASPVNCVSLVCYQGLCRVITSLRTSPQSTPWLATPPAVLWVMSLWPCFGLCRYVDVDTLFKLLFGATCIWFHKPSSLACYFLVFVAFFSLVFRHVDLSLPLCLNTLETCNNLSLSLFSFLTVN